MVSSHVTLVRNQAAGCHYFLPGQQLPSQPIVPPPRYVHYILVKDNDKFILLEIAVIQFKYLQIQHTLQIYQHLIFTLQMSFQTPNQQHQS